MLNPLKKLAGNAISLHSSLLSLISSPKASKCAQICLNPGNNVMLIDALEISVIFCCNNIARSLWLEMWRLKDSTDRNFVTCVRGGNKFLDFDSFESPTPTVAIKLFLLTYHFYIPRHNDLIKCFVCLWLLGLDYALCCREKCFDIIRQSL